MAAIVTLADYLKARPDRCSGCGYHPPTQGCRCSGESRKAAGIAATEASLTEEQKAAVDAAILRLNARGRPWSANDLRPLVPQVPLSVMGGRITSAHRRGLIRPTGERVPSNLPSTHAHELKEWTAV